MEFFKQQAERVEAYASLVLQSAVQEILPWVFTISKILLFIYVAWAVVQYIQIWRMSKTMRIIQFLLPKDNENEPHQMNLACKALWKCYPWYFRIFLAQPYYTFEIHAKHNEITFNILAPEKHATAVEKIIHSVYKDAESRIFPVASDHDYMNVYQAGKVSVGKVNLEKHYIFSLQTFKDWTQDPLSTITNSMTKLNEGDEITLQFVCRPIMDRVWQSRGKKILDKYETTGRMPSHSNLLLLLVAKLLIFPFLLLRFFYRMFFVTSTKVRDKEDQKRQYETLRDIKKTGQSGQIELKEQKSIGGKVTQHGFAVSFRIISKDNGSGERRAYIRDVASTLKQVDSENVLKRQHIILLPWLLSFLTKRRLMPLHNGRNILSTDELASLFHLPNKDVLTPNIKRIKSKQAPPPPEATRTENVFGESRFRGTVERIGIREKDLDKSIYALGKQGTGKTQVLENLWWQQANAKTGATFFMDPAGDAARRLIGSVPEHLIDDVYYLDLGDVDYPVSLNVLDQSNFKGKHNNLLKEQFIGILKREFKESWGPSTEDILRNAVELALVSDGSSLLEVMLAIISDDFRREYLDRLDNFVVRGYWRNEFEKLDPRFRNTATNAPLNKLRRITGDFLARNILCQRKTTVNLAWLFDNKKHVIVNLSKGTLGEENSRFIGSLLINYIYLLMIERQYTIPVEAERPKLTAFIDELQNYVSETVADMLAELRKFGFRMVVGHQYREQFKDENTLEGVFQLSRTKIFFNIGENNAEEIENVVAPRFTASDLSSLENYQCIVRLLIDGYEHPAFTLFTLPPLYSYSEDVAAAVIDRSRKLFFAGDEAIKDIESRYRRFVPDENDDSIRTPALQKKEKVNSEKQGTLEQQEHEDGNPPVQHEAVETKIKIVKRRSGVGDSQPDVPSSITDVIKTDGEKPKKKRSKEQKTTTPEAAAEVAATKDVVIDNQKPEAVVHIAPAKAAEEATAAPVAAEGAQAPAEAAEEATAVPAAVEGAQAPAEATEEAAAAAPVAAEGAQAPAEAAEEATAAPATVEGAQAPAEATEEAAAPAAIEGTQAPDDDFGIVIRGFKFYKKGDTDEK